MGNCDHQQFQFSIENIENFNDFEEAIDKSIDFEETIIFLMVLKRPLEIVNGFGGHHHH